MENVPSALIPEYTPSLIKWETALPVVAGGVLVAIGLQKRSPLGWSLAAFGGGVAALSYFCGRDQPANKDEPAVGWVKRSITINASLEDLYRFWSKKENLEKIIPGVKSIQAEADGSWTWSLTTPGGREIQWKTREVANRQPSDIHWKSTEDSPIDHHGLLKFHKGPGDRGNEVELTLSWKPRSIAAAALNELGLIGKAAAWHGAEALRRAKQLIETGELATASMGGRSL